MVSKLQSLEKPEDDYTTLTRWLSLQRAGVKAQMQLAKAARTDNELGVIRAAARVEDIDKESARYVRGFGFTECE